MQFIDIHTHQKNTSTKVFSVLNIYPNSANFTMPFSIGIHPWYLEEKTISEALKTVEKQLQHKNCIALGECGLDKLAKTDFKLQQEVFSQQIALSEKYEKPLIIHCVKAFDELIALKKQVKPKQVWIVHGFEKNKQLGKSLLKNGLFLSFGKALLQHHSLQELVAEINFYQFFLETDDAAFDIKELYQKVASIKQITVDEVIRKITYNFKEFILK